MKRRIAVVLAASTVFLCLPSMSSSSPFYGTQPGAAKKACLENGGTWTPQRQTCTF